MSKSGLKSKSNLKNRRLHFNKICRSCLSERGHLRDLFSTRLPLMMETCASIQVTENDGLPNKICVSCFHQIAKFYTFKKKLERNDKILRNYLKQRKLKENKEFSDILHKAVNDAEIITNKSDSQEDFIDESKSDNDDDDDDDDDDGCSDSDEDIPLSKRYLKDNKKELGKSSPSRLLRKSKQKANKMIDTIIKNEEVEEDEDEEEEDDEEKEESEESQEKEGDPKIILNSLEDIKKEETQQLIFNETPNSFDSVIFDGPPPLIPLASAKLTDSNGSNIESSQSTLKNLPQNAPPLVPIKPLSALNPATIVKALSDDIENPVKLKLQCNICNEEFNSVYALKNHRLYQCQASGMQCNICKKEFNDRTRLIGHLKGHMVSKDYGCKICGKCYPNPSTFRVHMRTHTGERPFKCPVCYKGFVRWAGVVGHMKTHNANKPYKCETCGKGFKISSNLERHKVLHSGILPYCCSYCGKTFSQSDNLQLHVRTYHTNDRPYLCNECGKRFVSATRLKRHMWAHTGYKPYRCRYCPKAYLNSNDLKNHEKGHTGGISDTDKPHACDVCDMRFLHPCRLAKHKKTHERPFRCSECKKTFSTETFLNKHLASKHGAQLLEHLSVPLTVEEVYINYQ